MCRNSSCGWAHVVPRGWSVRGGHFRVRSPGPAPSSLGLFPSRCVGHCPGHPVPSFSVPSGALVAVSHGPRWQKVSEAGRSPLSSPLPSLSPLLQPPRVALSSLLEAWGWSRRLPLSAL